MHDILKQNLFLVKEHVGLFKAANNFDIYDPRGGRVIMECREPKLGPVTKVLRFTKHRRHTPFDIRVTTRDSRQVVRVARGVAFFVSRVIVYDEQDNTIGSFKQKLFSLGGAFTVLDNNENPLCRIQGKWTGWDFRFLQGERELAHVTKKWAGAGKELLTSADNYVLQIAESVPADDPVRQLILAAVLSIDMVLKE